MATGRVRDFTGGAGTLQVDVVSGEVFETLTALYSVPDCCAEGTEYDDRPALERLLERLDDDLTPRVVASPGSWGLYLGLLGLAYDVGLGGSMAAFLAHLRTLAPVDVRLAILESAMAAAPEEQRIAAANGDAEAVAALADEHHQALATFLLSPVEEAVADLIDVVELFHDQAMRPDLDELMAVIERDALEKHSMARTLPAEALVEKATRGVTFEASPGIQGIVLIPSVLLSPWTLVTQRGSLRIFVYSVDPAAHETDPTAPPAHLVELYKALGDERRLRLLAELWTGDTDLKTLTERVDLAKSTTHHHLRALRTAGLVRVVMREDDKVYSLRKEALADAGPLLEDFLSRIPPRSDDDVVHP